MERPYISNPDHIVSVHDFNGTYVSTTALDNEGNGRGFAVQEDLEEVIEPLEETRP